MSLALRRRRRLSSTKPNRTLSRGWRFLPAYLLTLVFVPVAFAESPPAHTVRVEEEWEMTLKEPDSENGSPQVVMLLSPGTEAHTPVAVLELNHRTHPAFSAGGMQLQLWRDNIIWNEESAFNGKRLMYQDEKICWRQVISVDGSTLKFTIDAMTSKSWGTLDAEAPLTLECQFDRGNLDAYDATHTLEESAATYGADRIKSLKRLSVRRVLDNGAIIEDRTEQTVGLAPHPPKAE